MKARELRLMALALGGLGLIVAARGSEAAEGGDVVVDDSAEVEMSGDPNSGVASFAGEASPLLGSDGITLLDFGEVDQPGDTCADAVEDDAPSRIAISGGTSEILDPDNFARLVVDDEVAYGDLNGDGRTEAVLHAVCQFGANGAHDSIEVWDLSSGIATRVASLTEAPESVDSAFPPTVQSVAVNGSTVEVTWTQFGDDDPHCCPSQLAKTTYELTDDGLQLMGAPESIPAQ